MIRRVVYVRIRNNWPWVCIGNTLVNLRHTSYRVSGTNHKLSCSSPTTVSRRSLQDIFTCPQPPRPQLPSRFPPGPGLQGLQHHWECVGEKEGRWVVNDSHTFGSFMCVVKNGEITLAGSFLIWQMVLLINNQFCSRRAPPWWKRQACEADEYEGMTQTIHDTWHKRCRTLKNRISRRRKEKRGSRQETREGNTCGGKKRNEIERRCRERWGR